MAEPSTGALALAGVLSGVGAGVAFPQIDLAVLVGAFFYVVFAKDMTSLRRLGYLVAGWLDWWWLRCC
ncbi:MULTISPECIES: putative holin [Pseudomonas]|uniref:putative holin n=1 Tax=Pseudomonas TaxID=286 RepID=UPI000ACE7C37|nr:MULTISPECIES: putative holin [Pseudomonas]